MNGAVNDAVNDANVGVGDDVKNDSVLAYRKLYTLFNNRQQTPFPNSKNVYLQNSGASPKLTIQILSHFSVGISRSCGPGASRTAIRTCCRFSNGVTYEALSSLICNSANPHYRYEVYGNEYLRFRMEDLPFT